MSLLGDFVGQQTRTNRLQGAWHIIGAIVACALAWFVLGALSVLVYLHKI
jgi:hypothetical protein